jgi:hypothetical protein
MTKLYFSILIFPYVFGQITPNSNLFNSSSKQVVTNTAIGACSVYTADIDGDGDIDVISATEIDNQIAWYENGGQKNNPTFTKRLVANTATTHSGHNPSWVFAADINGDGNIDVMSSSSETDTVYWYENGGQANNFYFTKRVITNTAQQPRSVHAADIDGDGDIDVLSANWDDHTVYWYENRGQAYNFSFISHMITNTATNTFNVFAADINGDGDIDVVTSTKFGYIDWYQNEGQSSNPTFTKRAIGQVGEYLFKVLAADVNGDGKMDVLSASAVDDTIAFFENTGPIGNPSFTKRVITNTADGATWVHAADIDGDGDIDVLSSQAEDDIVAWYENGGQSSNPTFTKRVITTTADNVRSVYAADIDGDGDIDVLSASINDNSIAWYRNYRLSFINCPTGKYYGVINGSSVCINCAVGSYQNETSKSSCKSCPIGSYQNQTGHINCQSCPIGSYQNQIGQPICLTCPTGTNNTLKGQTSHSSCKFKNLYKEFLFMDL